MKRLSFLLLILCLSTSAQAQCSSGTCPNWAIGGDGTFRQPARIIRPRAPDRPTPAWRFVVPTGRYRAVVRVRGASGVLVQGQAHKLGSGVAARWAKRTVALTASHVVRGCRRLPVYLVKPKRWAAAVAAAVPTATPLVAPLAAAAAAATHPS